MPAAKDNTFSWDEQQLIGTKLVEDKQRYNVYVCLKDNKQYLLLNKEIKTVKSGYKVVKAFTIPVGIIDNMEELISKANDVMKNNGISNGKVKDGIVHF